MGRTNATRCSNSKTRRHVRRAVGLLLALSVLTGAAGCGSDGIDTSQIKAIWASYPTEHFVFYYPVDSPRAPRIANFSKECEEILAHVTTVLQVEPDMTIDFFVFTTDAQCDSLVGREAGFFADGQVFMRIGQHPGGLVALAACYFLDKKAASFDVLKAGMYQLYSHPSVNVHAETFGFERTNRFIPLKELGEAMPEKDRAVYNTEAASLCAFLLTQHGPGRFKMLWRSVLGFTESLEKIYRTEIGRLEGQWRSYYRKESQRT